MKKNLLISLVSLLICSSVFAQKASGYLGKKISVSAGIGINPFASTRTTVRGYNSITDLPGVATRFFLNSEYTVGEYTGLGLDLSLHNNAIVMFPSTAVAYRYPYPEFGAYKVRCININPVVKFYNKSMSPAPLGNFVSLGINLTLARLDSAKENIGSYPDFQNVDLLLSKGKLNFPDISFGFGRSFLIKKTVLFKMEMSFPYLLRFFPAMYYISDASTYVTKDDLFYDPTYLSTIIRHKVVFNNWILYNFCFGIPF